MMYKFTNDGRDLIPVSEIASLVISDDPKAITVFRNFLVNALTTGAIRPRSSYGFPVDFVTHFKINEDSLDDLTDDLVREATQPRSITDFTKEVDPRKVKRWARNRMGSEAKTAIKDAVLSGYLTQDDVREFLGSQGISCEWISPQLVTDSVATEASKNQQAIPKSATRVVTSDTKKRRFPLDDPIDAAIEAHGYKVQSIWAQLIEWATSGSKPFIELIGFTEEGIQYRGRKFQTDGICDILTRNQLSERVRKRKNKHPNPL